MALRLTIPEAADEPVTALRAAESRELAGGTKGTGRYAARLATPAGKGKAL